jgi:hypothetical protein
MVTAVRKNTAPRRNLFLYTLNQNARNSDTDAKSLAQKPERMVLKRTCHIDVYSA